MGCIFKVLIQVLYGPHWLTILDFTTKTSCGGYPIISGAGELFKRKKVLANHGTQFKTICGVHPASLILKGLVVEDVTREKTEDEIWRESRYKKEDAGIKGKVEGKDKDKDEDKDEDKGEGKIDEGDNDEEEDEEEEDDEEEYDEDHERDENEEFLFYTVEEFEELLKFITTEEKYPSMFYCYAPFIFTRYLTPIPMWCQMARPALPVNVKEIWLSEDQNEIDDVTNSIIAKQKELHALYRDELVKTFTNLPNEVALLTAEFSVPVALDVRVAINDDEGRSIGLVKEVQKYLPFMKDEKEAAQQQLREYLEISQVVTEMRQLQQLASLS